MANKMRVKFRKTLLWLMTWALVILAVASGSADAFTTNMDLQHSAVQPEMKLKIATASLAATEQQTDIDNKDMAKVDLVEAKGRAFVTPATITTATQLAPQINEQLSGLNENENIYDESHQQPSGVTSFPTTAYITTLEEEQQFSTLPSIPNANIPLHLLDAAPGSLNIFQEKAIQEARQQLPTATTTAKTLTFQSKDRHNPNSKGQGEEGDQTEEAKEYVDMTATVPAITSTFRPFDAKVEILEVNTESEPGLESAIEISTKVNESMIKTLPKIEQSEIEEILLKQSESLNEKEILNSEEHESVSEIQIPYHLKLSEIVTNTFRDSRPNIVHHYEVPENIPNNYILADGDNKPSKLNVVDLYAANTDEEFQHIIKDSNEKLIRERNFYTQYLQNINNNENKNKNKNGKREEALNDFTGKLLEEQDGIITEIEQKFQLTDLEPTTIEPPILITLHDEVNNDEAVAATATSTAAPAPAASTSKPTPTPTVTATVSTEPEALASVTPLVLAVREEEKPALRPLRNAKTVMLPPGIEFIERRVKKSFGFPMHHNPISVSDMNSMPYSDFANTKFTDYNSFPMQANFANTNGNGNGHINTKEKAPTSGDSMAAVHLPKTSSSSAPAQAIPPHPEFSTTKFYNSKEAHSNEQLYKKLALEQHQEVVLKLQTNQQTNQNANQNPKELQLGKTNNNAATMAGNLHSISTTVRPNVARGTQLTLKNFQARLQPTTTSATTSTTSTTATKTTTLKGVNAGKALRSQISSLSFDQTSSSSSAAAAQSSSSSASLAGHIKSFKAMANQQRPAMKHSTLKNPLTPPSTTTTTTATSTARTTTAATAPSKPLPTKAGRLEASPAPATNSKFSLSPSSIPTTNFPSTPMPATTKAPTSDAINFKKQLTLTKLLIKAFKPNSKANRINNLNSNGDFHPDFGMQIKVNKQPAAESASFSPYVPSSSLGSLGLASLTSASVNEMSSPGSDTKYTNLLNRNLHQAEEDINLSLKHQSSSKIFATNRFHISSVKPIARPRILSRLQEKINALECEIPNVPVDSHLWRGNETHELLLPIMNQPKCDAIDRCPPTTVSWEGEAEIQSGDILIVEINDSLLQINEINKTQSAHNTQVYQVTRPGHEHCDVTEGTLLDITPLVVDGRKLVTLYDKDLTEGVNLLIVVSELWGSQCVRLKVTTKTDNCGENADCSGKGVCYSNSAMEEYECQCCSGFAGPHCEEIDACTPSPCTNNGICVDLSQGHEGNSYQCLCPYGYTGKNCQYESDPCNSADCLNGGTCNGNSTHFKCDCTPGFTGPLCQHSLNECESSPCVHGICVDQEDGFRCFCQPGFAGELCNFEYNECESNPCQNGGECIDHIGSYECRCTKGYSGNRCHIKVDFCAKKPCADGQRCVDHGDDFTCECPEGLNGLDCGQMPRMQCNVNPCTHGGTCWTSGDSFYCACRPGFTGSMCEDEFVVETVVSSSEFIVDDTNIQNFNEKGFSSSIALKTPIELHNAYFAAGVLATALFIVAVVVTICHCKVNQTYRKFSTRSTSFIPIIGFGRRPKQQNKLNKHWLSGKSFANTNANTNLQRTSLTTPATATTNAAMFQNHNGPNNNNNLNNNKSQQQQRPNGNPNGNPNANANFGGQMHERPFQKHLAMNLENDMYYTVDFSENSQHSPLIQ